MSEAKVIYLITDCETGGLDGRMSPLLSVALLAANTEFKKVDNFEQKIRPPVGTIIEVPIPEHQDKELFKKTISHYMDVYTKQLYPYDKTKRPQEAPIINAVAAEINGYVKFKDGVWDIDSINEWNSLGRDITEAETSFIKFVTGTFKSPPVGVAHNADFDQSFIVSQMPRLITYYYKDWFCTCKRLRQWYKQKGQKGSAKLANLAELAGHEAGQAHTAYHDCETCLKGLEWLTKELG